MGELFETLFSLIPIALIIALRVAMSRKKKAEAEEKNRLIAFLTKQGMKPSSQVAGPGRPPVAYEEVGVAPKGLWVENEAPWNESYPDNSKVAPQLVSEFKDRFDPSSMVPQPGSVQAFVESPPTNQPLGPIESAEVGAVQRNNQKRSSGEFKHNLGRLTELRRAVVFSEILGPPKGLL